MRLKGTVATLAFLPSIVATAGAQEQPRGLTVVTGAITTKQVSPTRLDVIQSTQFGVANWQYLGNGAGQHTHFQLPGSDAVHVSRQVGDGASFFDGRVSSNGRLFLLNRSGVYFGQNARVDAAGLVASTSDIDPAKTISGGAVNLVRPGHAGAKVVNRGAIAADAVALLSPYVENALGGTIEAPLGRIALAAGEAFTVDFDGDNFIQFAVPESPVVQRALEVSNKGRLQADGGTVTLATDTARAVLDSVINTEGVVQARSMVKRGGKILLLGGGQTTTHVNGTLDASATESGAKGGTVVALGKTLLLGDGANLDVSGPAGGGMIRVGGDIQGKGSLSRAKVSAVAAGARLSADATANGDAGSIVVWADGLTMFLGHASARGGAEGGDGGFIEVSGKNHLYMRGTADTLAPNGTRGVLLLDPTDITIASEAAQTVTTGLNGFAEVMHFDTRDAGNTIGGGTFTTLTDTTGNGNNATAGTAPAVGASINGFQTAEFTGTENLVITNDNAINTDPAGYTAKTITLLFRTGANVSLATEEQVIYEQGGGTNGISFSLHNGEVFMNPWSESTGWGGGSGVTYVSAPVTANTTYIATLRYDGTAGTLQGTINGLPDNVLNTADTGMIETGVGGILARHTGDVRFGNNTDGIETVAGQALTGFVGSIGEMAHYNGVLDDDQLGIVEQGIAANFGITLDKATTDYNFLSEEYVESLGASSDVILTATNNITVGALTDGRLELTGGALSITAGNAFSMNTGDTLAAANGITLNATTLTLGNLETSGGAVNLTGTVNLTADIAITTANGAVTFNDTVDGAQQVTIDAGTGDVTFAGAVGGTTPLTTVQITDAGNVAFSNGVIATTYNQDSGGGALTGEFTVNALALNNVASADITGTVGGATDAAAAAAVTGGPFGNHFMNGCFINSGSCPSEATASTSLDIARLSFAPTYDSSAEGGQYDMGKRSNARGYLRTAMVAICSAESGDVESCLGELNSFAESNGFGGLAEGGPFDALRYLDMPRGSVAGAPATTSPRRSRPQAARNR